MCVFVFSGISGLTGAQVSSWAPEELGAIHAATLPKAQRRPMYKARSVVPGSRTAQRQRGPSIETIIDSLSRYVLSILPIAHRSDQLQV